MQGSARSAGKQKIQLQRDLDDLQAKAAVPQLSGKDNNSVSLNLSARLGLFPRVFKSLGIPLNSVLNPQDLATVAFVQEYGMDKLDLETCWKKQIKSGFD